MNSERKEERIRTSQFLIYFYQKNRISGHLVTTKTIGKVKESKYQKTVGITTIKAPLGFGVSLYTRI